MVAGAEVLGILERPEEKSEYDVILKAAKED